MLIVRDTDEKKEGEWFDFKTRGSKIKLKIRPLTGEVYERIRKKYKKVERIKDPQTRSLVKVDSYDDEAVANDLTDYVLEDFEGIGTSPDNKLEVNFDNKIRVMNIPAAGEELSISDFVFDKAREIAAVSEKEYKELEKN